MKHVCNATIEDRMKEGDHLCKEGYSGAKCKSCDFHGTKSNNNETYYCKDG